LGGYESHWFFMCNENLWPAGYSCFRNKKRLLLQHDCYNKSLACFIRYGCKTIFASSCGMLCRFIFIGMSVSNHLYGAGCSLLFIFIISYSAALSMNEPVILPSAQFCILELCSLNETTILYEILSVWFPQKMQKDSRTPFPCPAHCYFLLYMH